MANNVTPIETYYNGYRFRSRNEARWALFFDELHIPYDYEPEGFDLGNVWYLPDFHLTNGLILHEFQPTQLSQIWVEVKSSPELTDEERQKIAQFVLQTDHHVLLIAGQPDVNVPLRFIDHHPETGWLVTEVRWWERPDGKIGLVPVDRLNNSQLLAQTNTARLGRALEKARQERFTYQPPTKKCKSCGSSFKPWNPHHDRCYECYKKQREVEISGKKCKSCGTLFQPLKPNHVYCYECYKKQVEAKEPELVLPPITSPTQPAMVEQVTPAKAGQLVTPAPAGKKRQKRPTFRAEKPRKTRSLKKRLLIGCLMPIFVFACMTGLFIWFVAYMAGGGLFGPAPTAAPTMTTTAEATLVVTEIPTTPTVESNSDEELTAVCDCTANLYDCSDFTRQDEAQTCFNYCFESVGDIHFLDSNGDGLACETLP